jgi:aminobenzoyl-glutamate utilization protein B
LNDFRVEFLGTSAHSAAQPWEGRSALDALEMFNFGVNLLREHIRPTARIQYVIQQGGATPRDVPDHASGWYWIRDVNRPRVESLFERIRKVAQGAATATETKARITLLTGVHQILLNRPLQEALQSNLALVGVPRFTEEDLAFAQNIQAGLGMEPVARGFDTILHPLAESIEPPAAGSNDLAEVSWITPTARFLITAVPRGVPLHAWQASACLGTPMGGRAAVRAAEVLALTVVDLFTSSELRSAARKQFELNTAGKPYRSPVAGNKGIPALH